MSNPAAITHELYVARLFTFSEIQRENCHLAWPPEFSDLAMESFPGSSFAELVRNEAFQRGCATILQLGYPKSCLDVNEETLATAAKSFPLPFLDAYLSREIGRFCKKMKVNIGVEHQDECRSILLCEFVERISRFKAGECDGGTLAARRCANYCGAFMKGAWDSMRRLVFRSKDQNVPLDADRDSGEPARDPVDVLSFKAFREMQRHFEHDDLSGSLAQIIHEESAKSSYPSELRGLLSGALTTKEVVTALERSSAWVTACLLKPFIRAVQRRLRASKITVRVPGKPDLRVLRKTMPACFPGASSTITIATSDRFPDAPKPDTTPDR